MRILSNSVESETTRYIFLLFIVTERYFVIFIDHYHKILHMTSARNESSRSVREILQ